MMNFKTLFLFLMASSCLAFAGERAVIQQMKGKRAIVQFEKDIPFSVGQKVYLNSEDGTEFGVSKELRNPMERKNSINFASSFSTIDTKPKVTSVYAITARYGWNMERFEFGPVGSFTSTKNSSEYSKYDFGGFFDFNMIPNKPGEDFIWGGYGEGKIGNAKNGSVTSSLTSFTGGAFVKWFVFSPMLAVRANAFYTYDTLSKSGGYQYTNTETNLATNGFEIGLNHYF